MKLFYIIEWDYVKGRMIKYFAYFNDQNEANDSIEYFGTAEPVRE